MTNEKLRLLSFLRKLGRDERGSIIVQFTITGIAIMGMIGLALDGGRLLNLHSDLQKLADAAALAGAAKLDGTANALTNADAAARSVTNNVHWWDVSGANIPAGTAGVQFYETLADVDANNPTADPKQAKLVRVTTGAWQAAPTFVRPMQYLMPPGLAGPISNNSTRARAIARGGPSNSAQCTPQQMMLCNPNEPLGGGTGDASTFNPTRGQMFIFSTTGNTGGFSPGVFNLLDTPGGDGSDPAIKNYLSQQTAGSCGTPGAGTSPAQGQKTNATVDGINVRFDQQPNGNTSGMDLTPARITIDGLSHTNPANGRVNCNQLYDVSSTSYPLPLDPLPYTSVGGSGGTQIGNGPRLADLQTYWSNHHPSSVPFPTGATTRYEIYLAEDQIYSDQTKWKPTTNEPQGPQCAPAGTQVPPTYAASRRVLHVAVVDCVYWGVHGNSVNHIPISRYADFFLTHAVPKNPTIPTLPYGGPALVSGQIYTEFIQTHNINENAGSASGGCSGLCSITQLVR